MEAISNQDTITPEVSKQTGGDAVTFSLIFWLTFIVFLSIAVCSTVMRLPWRSWLPGAENSTSLIRSVRSAVYTLMSHLT